MISKVDYKFFDQAKKISETSDFKKAHVGCVAVYKGNVIAVGCSTNKTHPAQKYYNQFRIPEGEDVSMASIPKLHAEINCLNQLKHMNVNFAKVKLYIYRKCHDRPFGIARPCPSCMAAIKDFGIRDIYYTTNDGYAYEKLEKNKIGDVA